MVRRGGPAAGRWRRTSAPQQQDEPLLILRGFGDRCRQRQLCWSITCSSSPVFTPLAERACMTVHPKYIHQHYKCPGGNTGCCASPQHSQKEWHLAKVLHMIYHKMRTNTRRRVNFWEGGYHKLHSAASANNPRMRKIIKITESQPHTVAESLGKVKNLTTTWPLTEQYWCGKKNKIQKSHTKKYRKVEQNSRWRWVGGGKEDGAETPTFFEGTWGVW